MTTTYSYSIATDFTSANNIDINALQRAIDSDTTISVNTTSINSNIIDAGLTGATGTVDIVFPSTLSTGPTGQEQALVSLVNAYTYVSVLPQSMTPGFDAFVSNDVNYPGDYTSIAAAFNDGKASVYVKSGTYIETSDIIIPNGGQLFGEMPGKVVIVLVTGNSVKIDGSNGKKETTGTCSITNNTTTVTGSGTTFTNISAGEFVLLGTNYYEILTVDSNTQLTIKDTYLGASLSDFKLHAQPMHIGSRVQNLIIANSSGVGLYVRALRHGNLRSIAITKCSQCCQLIDCGDLSVQEIIPTFSSSSGITTTNCVSLSLHTINVFNSATHGIIINGDSTNIIMESCAYENNNGNGIRIEDTSQYVSIVDTVIKNNNSSGIYGSTGVKYTSISGAVISSNHGFGIENNSEDTVLSDSFIDNNGGTGIYCGKCNTIEGNVISNNSGVGIYIPTGSNNCIISDNNIRNNSGIGIELLSLKNSLSNNLINECIDGIYLNDNSNTICGNTISGSMGYGLYLSGTSSRNVINANIITENGGNGLELATGAEKNIVTSNNLYGNTGTNFVDNGTGTVGSNNITS